MRSLGLLLALWASLLSVQLPLPDQLTPDSPSTLLAAAATLAGLTVMVYRLGIWRQEMHNTKHNVGAEIARYREESNAHFASLERRFTTIDQFIAAATEQRVAAERWQARASTTLETHDRELTAIGARATRLEGSQPQTKEAT